MNNSNQEAARWINTIRLKYNRIQNILMVVLSRKVVEINNLGWLAGFVSGDGFLDDRHLEIYNSSPSTLLQTMRVLRILGVPKSRIKVDITTENIDSIKKWSKFLSLPLENVKSRKNLSPWKANKEMVRIRIASKEIANKLRDTIEFLSGISPSAKPNKHFVRGLFDAEASVDVKGYIEFKQVLREKGENIIAKTYRILNALDIECTEPKTKQDKNKKDIYFYVKDIEKYNRLIGFQDSDKQDKLNCLIRCNTANNKIDKLSIIKFAKTPITTFDIMKQFKCAYHTVRIPLNSLIKEGKIIRQREGLNIVYLTARQTR